MKKLRIFLTGGSGYIGRNIIEQLSDTHDIEAPSHEELELLNTKQVEKFFKSKKLFDVVIHCAFVGGSRNNVDTSKTLWNNLKMFFNIVRNENYFGKLINMGSGAEYGKQRPLIKVAEIDFDKVVPTETDYYGFAKYIIAKYIENSKFLINLRLFGVYGKYENYLVRFISNAICKSVLGMPITINRNVYFDYIFIDDFVKILNHIICHEMKFKTYNIGRGKSIDLVAIANKINKIAKRKSSIKIKHQGFANEYTCNNNRLTQELGSFKFTDFNKSLAELYEWYLSGVDQLQQNDLLNDYFY